MKKALPFIFPAIALVIVVLLALRWYSLRVNRAGTISPFAEGVEIEDLTQPLSANGTGVADYKKVELKPTEAGTVGDIRYELVDGKVRLTVSADLPEVSNGFYQVWIRDVDGKNAPRKAFLLETSKGGYQGSAAVSAEILPFEVVVSRELMDDNQLETVVMQGTMPKE